MINWVCIPNKFDLMKFFIFSILGYNGLSKFYVLVEKLDLKTEILINIMLSGSSYMYIFMHDFVCIKQKWTN